MSDQFEPDPNVHGHEPEDLGEPEETVDGIEVLAGPPRIVPEHAPKAALERRSPVAMIPSVQAAAVAAGGFVAGAAVLGLVHRRQQRSTALAQGRRAGKELSRRQARKNGAPSNEILQVVGSRKLLVDVHLLGGADRNR